MIDHYFQNLKEKINKNQIKIAIHVWSLVQDLHKKYELHKLSHSELGRRIWNCDETGICTAVASRTILARRGQKSIHETGGGSGREYITILAGGSAIGERLPPYILYKGKNLMSNHTRGGPQGTRYSMSDSGWMETANFHEWFVKLFLPAVSDMLKTRPVLLFLDGHKSHEAIDLLEIAKSKGVIMYMLPPHSTPYPTTTGCRCIWPFKTTMDSNVKAL